MYFKNGQYPHFEGLVFQLNLCLNFKETWKSFRKYFSGWYKKHVLFPGDLVKEHVSDINNSWAMFQGFICSIFLQIGKFRRFFQEQFANWSLSVFFLLMQVTPIINWQGLISLLNNKIYFIFRNEKIFGHHVSKNFLYFLYQNFKEVFLKNKHINIFFFCFFNQTSICKHYFLICLKRSENFGSFKRLRDLTSECLIAQ